MKTKVFYAYFLLCIFFVLFSCKEDKKTNVIQLNLDANNYSELILKIQTYTTTFNPFDFVDFNGVKKGNGWTFCYPDSLYDKSVGLTIVDTTHINLPGYIGRYIGFKYICNKDTLETASLSFANKNTTIINATYLQTDTVRFPADRDIKGNTIFNTYLIDFYLLTSCQDKELLSALELAENGFFRYDLDSSQYDAELEEYMDLVKKYPDSHCLIQTLDFGLRFFKSKKDVQKVFDYFSQDNKNSFFGKRVNRYLTDNHFKNSILKTWDTGKSEAIVIDSAKYNLIIFSSSGCRPCIEEIPILKQTYADLSDKLDMVYVSIDNSKTADEWRKLMRKENIPWRSVLAEDDVDVGNIIEKYHVFGVPYCLFVHPDGFMEVIDVRIKEDKDKLYSLCGK